MSNNKDYAYKFQYAHDNVYGHVVSLLENIELSEEHIHLDLGCGWGAICDKISENHKLHYLGVDASVEAVEYLNSRGKEAYSFMLSTYEENIQFLKSVLGSRKVASISVIDILEHVLYPEELIKTIVELSREHHAPVVISVPNFTHDDVVFKLFCNKFDETNSGLLDKTHLNIFTEEKLISLCNKYGFHQIGKKDIVLEKSDQHFPRELLTIADQSSLAQLMINLRRGIGSTGKVNQFVRMFLAGPPSQITDTYNVKRPFLSIVTRTTGDRPEELKETLLCLTGQECTDFEVLVVGHNLTVEKQLIVEKIINDTPEWIRNKIRLIRVNGGNRSTPLNEGFKEANGQYISILDDDDLVFSNWVQEFKNLSEENYGKILKSVTVRQEYEPVKTSFGEKTSRAVTGFFKDYPAEFDFLKMLHHNQCPGLCLAFPRSIFHDFGLRFDENINTIEDWDFIVRATFICGVADSGVVTNIYRWWLKGSSSQTLHSQEEWQDNYRYVQNKFNSQYIILPPGYVKKISTFVSMSLNHGTSHMHINDESIGSEDNLTEKRETAHLLLTSNSWNITKPLRLLKYLMGSKTCIPNIFVASEEQLDELIVNIYNSRSWKLTKFLRRSTYK
ncbi:methyltransferase domain-containing protein [Paenibacillus chitinolyticus]|uniref:methyltransferase domain-containing protein n=1 Tax=Paenibacillus chitinolyticus TaxID=79263 RepID=UPI002DBEB25D|nr:methyltransferase domain-containing protein [Paenibacillus chitinolyticus]MEC0245088.1 methyltransferase domain-containing protein [Paenibacillus chitinolyticus]